MNKYILLLTSLFMVSCSNNTDGDSYKYEYFDSAMLSISQIDGSYLYYGNITEGNKTVFKYTFVAEDEELIADDEYGEYIQFEIDSNVDNFLLENEDLESSNTILTKSCFCFFPESDEKNVPPVGFISGEKISINKWRVNFNVTFYGDDLRTFIGEFVLNEI